MTFIKLISNKLLTLLLALLLLAAPLMFLKPVTALGSNLINNPSVETTSPTTNTPLNWLSNSWGTNTANFEYLNTGYTGNRSIKTTITSYTSGDAKWYFNPVNVIGGKSYTYSVYYQANTTSEIVLQITDTSGNIRYQWLKTAPASASWTQVSAVSTLPANANKVSVFHVINKVGWMQTDDAFYGETTTTNPIAPTVSIVSPANNAIVSGVQNINASASNSDINASLIGVQFKVNGANFGTEITNAPYSISWDTNQVANGSYILTAEARSTNGLSTLSSPITVNVNNSVTPPVDNDNLILNPSLESTDPMNSAKPVNWQFNSWGTNTASFQYLNNGRTGNRSIKTTITSHTSGDAKWYFDNVSVQGGKSYLFRNYYKSNVTTRVVAAFTDSNGAVSYAEISSVPAAINYTQYQEIFTAPATAVKASVFHVLDRVGELTIDDAYLQVAPQTTPDATIPNGSVELGTTSPTNWLNNKWGTNTANFEYITNNGYTGNKSVKVSLSNYTSGDAKWYFNPITNLVPGKQYRFTAYYKTNVTPHVAAMFNMSDGTTKYFGMPNAVPTSNAQSTWQKYTDTFQVPDGAISVSAFMFINQNGWLQTDAYTINDYSAVGFNRPMLSITFDDGFEDNATTALPLLNQYGFKSTQCYATTFIEGNQQAINDILKFKNSGHEICSHTVTHPFLTSLNATSLDYELRHSKEFLERITGQEVVNFASPYGDYNQTVNTAIAKYYQSHRTVDEGFNSKDNFDIYRLRVQNILDTTSANQVKVWIDQAKADNTWLILVYHRVASNPGPFDSYTNVFSQHLATIKASGISVQTYQSALTEAKSQL